jgi:hypothetical protein
MNTAPAQNFQKIWFNQIPSLKCECKDTIEQHPDAGDVMEQVHVVLTDTARLAAYAPVTIG